MTVSLKEAKKGLDGTAQNGVRGVGDETGLPEVLTVVILQLADGLDKRRGLSTLRR